MNWNQFLMYADDPSDSGTWISGIYKIRSYTKYEVSIISHPFRLKVQITG